MSNNDLISRAAILDVLVTSPNFHTTLTRIEELPAVDAVPVRHGHWIDWKDEHQCSECRETTIVDYYVWSVEKFNFCPYCGVNMDEVEISL